MATTAKKSKKTAKAGTVKKGRKAAQKAEAVAVVNPREVFDSFNPRNRTFENYSAFCKANHIRLNQTGRSIVTEGDVAKQFKSLDQAVSAFAESSTRWEANEQYGRQHYNKDGFMHRDGLTRLPDESLGHLMAQAAEELAQRAAFKGTEVVNKKINPDTAAALLRTICNWGLQRPASVANSKRLQAYAEVAAETGIKLETIAQK